MGVRRDVCHLVRISCVTPDPHNLGFGQNRRHGDADRLAGYQKITYPQDARFSKYVFVVAPGLTVKSRLQVLLPAG